MNRSHGLVQGPLTHEGNFFQVWGMWESLLNTHGFLVRDKQLHSGVKPCGCTEYGRAFSKSAHLLRHHLIPTRQRPYECKESGKAFHRRSQLTAHQWIHTGEKPYECSECGKAFHRRSQLTTHQLIHTREKPLAECSECGMGFCDSTRAHEALRHPHRGEAPQVPRVRKAFYRQFYLMSTSGPHWEKPLRVPRVWKGLHLLLHFHLA